MAIFKKNEERENALTRVNENLESLQKIQEITSGGLNNIGIAGRVVNRSGKEHQTAFFDLSPQIAKKIVALFNQQRQVIVKQILSDAGKYEIELTDKDMEIINMPAPRKQEPAIESEKQNIAGDPVTDTDEQSTQADTAVEIIDDSADACAYEEEPSSLRNLWRQHNSEI